VAKRKLLAVRHALGKPAHHAIEVGIIVIAAAKLRPLVRPPRELPREIIAGLPEVGKAERLIVERVNRRERRAHRAEERRALLFLEPGRREIVEDPPVQPFHQIERRAEDLAVLAIKIWLRRRHAAPLQGAEHAIFAVDRMRRRHQHVVGLFSQHAAPIASDDEIGRIRHASLRALDADRRRAAEPAFQIFVELGDVEIDAAAGRRGRRHPWLARLPLKPKRYCATRRI
jgi:hypothetical protein